MTKTILCLLLTIVVVLPAYSSTADGSGPGSDINASVDTDPQSDPSRSAHEPVGPDSDSVFDSNAQGTPHFPNTNAPPSPHIRPSNPNTTQPSNQTSPPHSTNKY